MLMRAWNEDRTNQLKGYLSDGLTAREISEKLDVSRSAVIGKLKRLGLRLPPHPSTPLSHPARNRPIKMPAIPLKTRISAVEKYRTLAVEKPPAKTDPVTILDLNPRTQCRAVVDKRDGMGLAMFCGRRRLKWCSYCRDHAKQYLCLPVHH